jgi:hypothetical protein
MDVTTPHIERGDPNLGYAPLIGTGRSRTTRTHFDGPGRSTAGDLELCLRYSVVCCRDTPMLSLGYVADERICIIL